MGILRSRTIFLIIGILSLTVVNGQILNRNEILEELKRQANRMDLVHSAQFEQESEEFIKSVGESCKKNGGEKAYDEAKSGLEKFENCLKSVLAPKPGSRLATRKLDDVIKFICPKVQPLDDCIEQFSNSIDPCLDDETRKAGVTLRSFTISFLDYICENEGEHIKTFVIDGGPNCVASHQTQLTNCLDTFIISVFANFLLVGPNVDECKSLEELEYCVEEELEKCTKSISEIGTSMLDILFEKMDCEEILASAASPTTIINSILVITGIAMFL